MNRVIFFCDSGGYGDGDINNNFVSIVLNTNNPNMSTKT